MWKELAREVYPESGFVEPATPSALNDAERVLSESLPEELRSLLAETNGILAHTSSRAVWPVEEIVRRNVSLRQDESLTALYMSFDPFLFFGDNGGGDLFAFVIRPQRPDIFVWQHESDSRKWVARNLQDYLRRRLVQGGDDWYEGY
ncbi:SMI1/KNR4 family protein [Streptacidiphilus sp. MAP5-3]|uniref:SMI1/KNR4 family protein n=1 Tax=unclassified Streptacidiphilus TaxID=2643834 RepID=UPI0035125830